MFRLMFKDNSLLVIVVAICEENLLETALICFSGFSVIDDDERDTAMNSIVSRIWLQRSLEG